MYYRVAILLDQSLLWKWKSTALSSLGTLFQFLRLYHAIPQDHLCVFSSSSREELDVLLACKNNGDESSATTAAQFLQDRRISVRQVSRNAAEHRESSAGENQDKVRSVSAVSTLTGVNESELREPQQDERNMNVLDRRRLVVERGAGGDHDVLYTFALPPRLPEALAWVRLLAKIQDGTIQR